MVVAVAVVETRSFDKQAESRVLSYARSKQKQVQTQNQKKLDDTPTPEAVAIS